MITHRQTLSPVDCVNHYAMSGGNIGGNYFSSNYPIQRGYGIFSNLGRYAIPLMLKVGKYLGKSLLTTGKNVLDDVSQGKAFKTASRDRIFESGRAIKKDILRKLQSGGGIKRQKRDKKKQFKRRKINHKDVFSAL